MRYNETSIETWRNDMTKGNMSTDKIGTVVVKGWVGGAGRSDVSVSVLREHGVTSGTCQLPLSWRAHQELGQADAGNHSNTDMPPFLFEHPSVSLVIIISFFPPLWE